MTTGIILDLETTGLDPKSDKIIEIGILKVALDQEETPRYVSSYSQLQDPKVTLSETIIKLTGINDDLVRGKNINWEEVYRDIEESSFVIAHNMPFDRSFLLEMDLFRNLKTHWVCSQRHIDWKKRGFRSTALNYLACDHGFVNPFPHRALFDCATTFRLISPYFSELLHRSYQNEFLLLATGAPFKAKDLLKERAYRWDPVKRVWHKNVFEADLEEEEAFLLEKIYDGKRLFEQEKL